MEFDDFLQDGVPFVTEKPIVPGESRSYEFVANRPGSLMYHSHHNATDQVGRGLLGAFVVDPKNPTADDRFDRIGQLVEIGGLIFLLAAAHPEFWQEVCARHAEDQREVPLDLEDEHSDARRIVLEKCRSALARDGSGAIVLGCAGMADLADRISREIEAPVLDGVAAAVKFVEALVSLGLGTSKAGDLAYPLPKPYSGSLAHLKPAPASGSHKRAALASDVVT